jgi:hypothetical protein
VGIPVLFTRTRAGTLSCAPARFAPRRGWSDSRGATGRRRQRGLRSQATDRAAGVATALRRVRRVALPRTLCTGNPRRRDERLSPWYGAFIVGTIIVAIQASARFNRPSWYRTYTTEARFDLAQALFALLQMLIFFAVCLLLLRVGRALIVDANSELAALVMASPILLAIAAVIVLPSIPRLDRWPREQLHRIAGAPEQGLLLARLLEEAEFVPSDVMDEETRSLLLHRGVDPAMECVAPARAVRDQSCATRLSSRCARGRRAAIRELPGGITQ